MARAKTTAKKASSKTAKVEREERTLGTTPALYPLGKLIPNTWNPTAITEAERERIRHGLETDGWIASQALLVWRIDDKGVERNVIIDGEQRFTIARELGFTVGFVSFVDGLTEVQAKALTVKLNGRRAGGGRFDPTKLSNVVTAIKTDYAFVGDLGSDLGLDAAMFRRITAPPSIPSEGARNGAASPRQTTHTCPSCGSEFKCGKGGGTG